MTKLVIFDLDGTLLDTLSDLTDSVNYAMTKLDLPTYSSEQVRMMIGNGVSVLMARAVTENRRELQPQALALQREYYNAHIDKHTKPYDGVKEMLSDLIARGFTPAVHSNKDENCARELCDKYFGGLITYVCGTTDYAVTKPNPIKIVELMNSLGVNRNNAVYCGDSDVDIATARNAGIACVSVTWGFRSAEFLREHGASYVADTPRQLTYIIDGIMRLA